MNTTTDNLVNAAKETKGFEIYDPGDPSVGIFPSRYEISGPFFFESENDLKEFQQQIKQVFEDHITEHTVIYTFEQIEKREQFLTAYEQEKIINQSEKIGKKVLERGKFNPDQFKPEHSCPNCNGDKFVTKSIVNPDIKEACQECNKPEQTEGKTLIQQLIEEFETIQKTKCKTMQEVVFFDGVLAIIDGYLAKEKEQTAHLLKTAEHFRKRYDETLEINQHLLKRIEELEKQVEDLKDVFLD